MTENENEPTQDQQGYDASQDPDADPEVLASAKRNQQPDQAEGEDVDEAEGSGS